MTKIINYRVLPSGLLELHINFGKQIFPGSTLNKLIIKELNIVYCVSIYGIYLSKSCIHTWGFSVGICKYKLGYKSHDLYNFECTHWWKISLFSVISTQIITGHVIYNLAYTYKFQLKTTLTYIFYMYGTISEEDL